MSVHEEIDEYARWQARFATPDYAFGKEPNYFLKSCRKLLPRHGRALAVADGEGRNGVWLAEQGLDVLSLDFSPAAQNKARALAAERGVKATFVQADVHAWDYPETAFDVVVEIFAQFSPLAERASKWRGIRRSLKPGGLLIIQGYTPKQIAVRHR
jgi:SAM-dependent methyltransferase